MFRTFKRRRTDEAKTDEPPEDPTFPFVEEGERFIKGRLLASGGYGKVYICTDKLTSMQVALKEVDTTAKGPDKIDNIFNNTRKEVIIQKSLDHPNIVKIISSFRYKQTPKTLYLAMDLCTGGELFEAIQRAYSVHASGGFNEENTKSIIRQTLMALKYCHEHGIVQLDIKPENIMLETPWDGGDFPNVKLVDFGLSEYLSALTECSKVRRCIPKGTPGYIAPELQYRRYGAKADVFSVGVLTYVLLAGGLPWDGVWPTREQTNDLDFTWFSGTELAREFVKKLLAYDPENRLTAEQALQDPWLNSPASEDSLEPIPEHIIRKIINHI